MNRKLAPFVLVLLLAFVSRLLNIDAESVWVDEGFSYWAIRHDDMLRVIANDVHPPLYFVGLRGWAAVAGITEFALRYFSLLPSLLSVAVIYQVGAEVQRLRGRALGAVPLLAALLLALADMETYIAQTIRMYSWHVLWVLVSMAFFLRWVRLGRRVDMAAWLVANLLLLYTQYLGLAALGVQGLYALLCLRGRARVQGVAVLALAVVAFIPWGVAVVAGQTDNVGTGFNVPSALASLWNWRIEWFTGQWPLMLGLALLGTVSVIYAGERIHKVVVPYPTALLLWAWLIVPVAGAYILNFYTPILMDYRLTQITPAVALLVALGLGNLRRWPQAFLVAVIIAYGVTTYDTPRPRPQWRQIGIDAAQYATSGDLAMAHVTPSGDWQMVYYFERFMPPGVERRSLRQWQLEQGTTYADGLPALLDAHPVVWFMHWSSDRSGFDALASTDHTQTMRRRYDWQGSWLDLYRFDNLPDGDLTAYESGLVLRHAVAYPDSLRLDLWWRTDAPLRDDIIISAIVLDATGRLVAQSDAQPFNNTRPTSGFGVDEVVYDPHNLTLVDGVPVLPPGAYTFAVKTYTFAPDATIRDIPTADGADYFIVGTFDH